ncbi:MAG: hypothetical protein H6740_20870 [Alphaproteobacteria bacterium]|nr:hypothetical protein [Alphaproteobacteria bacterium]
MTLLLLLLGCARGERAAGEFDLVFHDELGLSVSWRGAPLLELEGWSIGYGEADIEFRVGSYRFSDEETTWTPIETLDLESSRDATTQVAVARDATGGLVGTLEATQVGEGLLLLNLRGAAGNRSRARFACQAGDSFLGGGGHNFDVDHAGEAFALWVSEPGIGKVDTDSQPDDWYLTGTRHSASYPVPFFLRPQGDPLGLSVLTSARVEVDLCRSGQLELVAWESDLSLLVTAAETPLRVVERHAQATGLPLLPPDWAFAPWNDAVRGADRVREVAATLREAGAPSSVIWTEDWKGAEENSFGYHLLGEWEVDEDLYPEAQALAEELERQGFKWFAYFSPFIEPGASVWDEAQELVIRDAEGEPYVFLNPIFQDVSVLDLSREDARAWAQDKMRAALDLGFDGWMADYAEWLPPDAQMSAMDPLSAHNAYPQLWQATNQEVLDGEDAVAFSRSGWLGSASIAPITWGGDQQTSFGEDDGLPTVLPMGIGLGISGVAFFGHDIAGYSSIGVDPSDKELWFRWCTLGAFSPIMRTHHGAYDSANWQFDTDAETTAHYARYAQEHARLFPYLRGLAEVAGERGRPLILHPALVVDGWPWDNIDAWMLGDALFVAPVLERGAEGRDVDLPDSAAWYDWFTGEPAAAGWFDAPVDEIPVFARSGTVVPTLAWAPDTFTEAGAEGVTTLAEADLERVIYVFGEGGSFTEADGTTYSVSGTATPGEGEGVFASGEVTVGGLTVSIDGGVERAYTVVVR